MSSVKFLFEQAIFESEWQVFKAFLEARKAIEKARLK